MKKYKKCNTILLDELNVLMYERLKLHKMWKSRPLGLQRRKRKNNRVKIAFTHRDHIYSSSYLFCSHINSFPSYIFLGVQHAFLSKCVDHNLTVLPFKVILWFGFIHVFIEIMFVCLPFSTPSLILSRPTSCSVFFLQFYSIEKLTSFLLLRPVMTCTPPSCSPDRTWKYSVSLHHAGCKRHAWD